MSGTTKHRSGSPRAQQERKQQYRKQSGPVGNPGQPSTKNRAARRHATTTTKE